MRCSPDRACALLAVAVLFACAGSEPVEDSPEREANQEFQNQLGEGNPRIRVEADGRVLV